MRLSDIVQLAKSYLLLGVMIAAVVSALFSISYFLIYKRLLKGTKRLAKGKVALSVIAVVYLIVILGATFASRGNYGTGNANLILFRSYREAWYNFSGYEWQSLILNILLFVPFGFLLPLLGKRLRYCWVTVLSGFAFSLLIETIQLLTHRGIADIDDLFNNTLGVTIGFGLVCIYWRLKRSSRSGKETTGLTKIRTSSILILQIPLFLTLTAFSMIFSLYYSQELGNLDIAYAHRIKMVAVQVTTELDLDDQPRTADVFQTVVGSVEDAAAAANRIFAAVDKQADASRTDLYQDSALFQSVDGQASVWIDFLGLSAQYINHSQQDNPRSTGLSFIELRELLKAFSIALPENAAFTNNGNGEYKISAKMAESDEHFLDGQFKCTVVNGNIIATFKNDLIAYKAFKAYDVISEKAAYQKILDGKFQAYTLGPVRDFEVVTINIGYRTDSKGFFQPVYEFGVKMTDGSEDQGSIIIPALP